MATEAPETRNVHLYDEAAPDVYRGGTFANDSTPRWLLLRALRYLIVSPENYEVVHQETGQILTWSNERLDPGVYMIRIAPDQEPMRWTEEPPIVRPLSRSAVTRKNRFRDDVRARDRKCVMTGARVPSSTDPYTSFEAAHIFPISQHLLFNSQGYQNRITYPPGFGVDSCQNGMLLQSSVHQLFDRFHVAVDPQNDYRIVAFQDDFLNIDGRQLDEACRRPNDERGVRDELLEWHFKQAVLANMKGAGMLSMEDDFPPGNDQIAEICQGPYAAERMEAELSWRLFDVEAI